jgi:hypothetical protein
MEIAGRTKALGWATLIATFFGYGRGTGAAAAAITVVVGGSVAYALWRLQRSTDDGSEAVDLSVPMALVASAIVLAVIAALRRGDHAADAVLSGASFLLVLAAFDRYPAAMARWCRARGWSVASAFDRARANARVPLAAYAVLGVLIAAGHQVEESSFELTGIAWEPAGPAWLNLVLMVVILILHLRTMYLIGRAHLDLRAGITRGAEGQPTPGFTAPGGDRRERTRDG